MRAVTISNIYANKEPVKAGNQLFEHSGNISAEENISLWKQQNYDIVPYIMDMVIEEDDIILFSDRVNFWRGWRFLCKRRWLKNTICILIESDVVDRKCGKRILMKMKDAFPVIMTYQDDMVDNAKYFKYWPAVNSNIRMMKSPVAWQDRGLAAIVCGNKRYHEVPGELYTERKRIIDYFEEHREYLFGVAGKGWRGYRNWKGMINSKADIYHNYKFAICLENSRANGYITEKIFDCFKYGIVPVYGGAYNINDYIPKECYIDYFQFKSLDEMVNYLQNMNEAEYNQYLSAIEIFLQSEQLHQFGQEAQVKRIYQAIHVLPDSFHVKWTAWINMLIFVRIYELRKVLIEKVLLLKSKLRNRLCRSC